MDQGWALAAVLAAGFTSAAAQGLAPPSLAPPAGATVAASSPASVRLAADTPVNIELVDPVSSKDRTRGDKFAIRLAAPIVVDGATVAPAGATGEGEVVYAQRGGAGGSPGKLVLAARYLDVAGVRVRLKAFNLAAGGESEFREMQVAAELIGPAVLFINGHNVVYPAGTRARAKVTEDVLLPTAASAIEPPASAAAGGPAPTGAARATPAGASASPSTTPSQESPK
jgi:hypothetical protein